ncbi:DegV family protein [Kribbia dieselivorans]|uniref:DegV family protein n=1 Tax=Kribbia dieselivorans TaxID=331526 RepID=UPI000837AC07|nr:DegV family protein [Kribbia dieselivorans]
MRTAIVTDSTACLPVDMAAAAEVTVVPLHVVVDGVDHREGIDVSNAEVAEALRRGAKVTTSQPSPEELEQAYTQLADEGYQDVVSVHISGGLSGTVGSAEQVARRVPINVHVVDSGTLGMAMGYPVLRAAALAARGEEDAEVIAEQARWECASSYAAFYVDTLEYLGKGGRIGKAAVFMGTALSIKPLLVVRNGVLAPLERVRTASKALTRLVERAVDVTQDLPVWASTVDIAVHHFDAADRARTMLDMLNEQVPRQGHRQVVEIGAVVGAHTGPGIVAVAISPYPARMED